MNKNQTIARILEIEVDMFLRVPTAEEPSCRAHMEDMKLHRRGQLSVWSEATRESYLNDLTRAREENTNLMTLKYARMDNLIEPLSDNPHIARICDQYVTWQRDVIERYPNTMRRGRDIDDFANYLTSELETYSDRTLDLLWKDVETSRKAGGNLSVAVYAELARQAGYTDLDEMEERLT